MPDYSIGDVYEDFVNNMLNSAWKRIFTKLNRIVVNGKNQSQIIHISENESHILPDITVFYDASCEIIEMRIEVKGFHQLPKKESPNPELSLFPIKFRQLAEYISLSNIEEIECRIVLVIGDKTKPDMFKYYWMSLKDINKFTKKEGIWDREFSYWFNIDEMNKEFGNF